MWRITNSNEDNASNTCNEVKAAMQVMVEMGRVFVLIRSNTWLTRLFISVWLLFEHENFEVIILFWQQKWTTVSLLQKSGQRFVNSYTKQNSVLKFPLPNAGWSACNHGSGMSSYSKGDTALLFESPIWFSWAKGRYLYGNIALNYDDPWIWYNYKPTVLAFHGLIS